MSTAKKVVLWMGPVSTDLVVNAIPDGWVVRTFNQGDGGIGSEAFKRWAAGLGADPLSRLAPGAERIVMAGFSAAHGAHEVILGRVVAANDRRLVGLAAFDAYYVANGAPPKPNHLAWLRWILERREHGAALFTTGASHGGGYESARVSFRAVADAVHLVPRSAPPGVPGTPAAASRGGILWLDYDDAYSHEAHAKALAPALLHSHVALYGSERARGGWVAAGVALAAVLGAVALTRAE